MKVTIMLADFAQTINNKLYIMGGGWSLIGPAPCPYALAIKIEVPWNQTNQKHYWKVELMDADYRPIVTQTPNGTVPICITGEFEVGRPPGLLPGSPIDMPIALNVPAIPLEAGKRYVWKLTINDKTDENWQVAFSTRSADGAKH